TAAWLADHPGAVPTAVGAAAGAALPSAPQVGGDDPVALSVAVATEFFDAPTAAGLATREVFPDALVGAIAIAAEPGPMLLTARDELPTELAEYLQGPGASILHLRVFGGTEAITDA